MIIAFDACSSNAILAEEQCVKLTYFKSILFGVFFLCVYVCLISFHYIHVVYVVSLQGLFSRITFREPVFLGGTGNITGLAKRLPVSVGMTGCIRKFVANEHEYVFAATPSGDVVQGFDIRKYCNFIFFLYDEDDKETERKIKSNLKSIVEFPFDMPILERMWLLCGYFLWLHKNANGLILCGDPGPFQVLHCFDSLLRYL